MAVSPTAMLTVHVIHSQEASTPGLRRDDPTSYGGLSAATYGLAPDPAVFTPQVVRNRQDPRVVGAMTLLLGDEDVLVSQDRWCCYRPTRGVRPPSGGGPAFDRPDWKTRGNLHLDLHPVCSKDRGNIAILPSSFDRPLIFAVSSLWPWTKQWNYDVANGSDEMLSFESLRDFPRELNRGPHAAALRSALFFALTRRQNSAFLSAVGAGPHIQGVLALLDCRAAETHGGAEDGGTLLVPGFHHRFDRWQRALGPVEGHLIEVTKSEGTNWLVSRPREGGGASYKVRMPPGQRTPTPCHQLLTLYLVSIFCAQPLATNSSPSNWCEKKLRPGPRSLRTPTRYTALRGACRCAKATSCFGTNASCTARGQTTASGRASRSSSGPSAGRRR